MSDTDWALLLGCILVGIGVAAVAVAVTLAVVGIFYGIRRAVLRCLGRRRAPSPGAVEVHTDALRVLRQRLVDEGHLPDEQTLAEQNGHRGGQA